MADGLWLVPCEAGVSRFSWDCHWPSAIVGRFPREWRKVINSNSGGLRNLPDVSSTSRRFVTGTSILVGRFPAGMECRYWVLKAAASGILRLAKSSSRRFKNYTSLHSPEGEPHLFLSALLANEVSCAEGRQHGDAAAEGCVLVVTLAVSRVRRRCIALLGKEASPLIYSVAVVAAVLAVEHAALGETRHGHSEYDGEGDYLFFHRCICC